MKSIIVKENITVVEQLAHVSEEDDQWILQCPSNNLFKTKTPKKA